MSTKLRKLTVIFSWVLMALTVVFTIVFYVGGVVDGTEGTRYEEPVITDAFMTYAYILLGLTALVTVYFSIRNLILNPKGFKMVLVALVAAVVVIGVAALMADNTVLDLPHYKGKDNVPKTLFLADTGLYTAYFLAVIAFVAIIYSEVSKFFKK